MDKEIKLVLQCNVIKTTIFGDFKPENVKNYALKIKSNFIPSVGGRITFYKKKDIILSILNKITTIDFKSAIEYNSSSPKINSREGFFLVNYDCFETKSKREYKEVCQMFDAAGWHLYKWRNLEEYFD